MRLNKNNMKLIIRPFSGLPCELEVFTINGKNADERDFGDTYDHNEESTELYGCVDKYFEPKSLTKEVLDKYNITKEQYYTICKELEDKLYIGHCMWCV